MEAVLNALVSNGIGGCMAAVVAYFMYTLISRTIPDMMARQSKDLLDTRTEFRAALKDQQETFYTALNTIEARWQVTTEALCSRLENVDRHVKANQDHVIGLQAHVIAQFGKLKELPPPHP